MESPEPLEDEGSGQDHTPLPLLLLVDDDEVFRCVLARALERRGYRVIAAGAAGEALECARAEAPQFAVVDLKLGETSGLTLIESLHALSPETRIVMLTGYASIATAVAAIKLGAANYIAKPCDADAVVAAFSSASEDAAPPPPETPLPVGRLEWEHIQRILAKHDGNISATARALKMHRRTLQRKLGKKPVRE
ncbi:MAG: response regulator [Betaproteobacteria bacterium]|nr:response regulator [Betaproteobacteria bacterium]